GSLVGSADPGPAADRVRPAMLPRTASGPNRWSPRVTPGRSGGARDGPRPSAPADRLHHRERGLRAVLVLRDAQHPHPVPRLLVPAVRRGGGGPPGGARGGG